MQYIHLVIPISIFSFSCRNRKRKRNLWLHVPKRRRFDKQVSQDPSPTATAPTYTPKQPNLQILNSGTPRQKKNKKKKQKKKKKKKKRAYLMRIILVFDVYKLADNNHSSCIRFLFVKPQSHCHVLRPRFYYILKRSRTAIYVVNCSENVLYTTIYGYIWLRTWPSYVCSKIFKI